MRRARLTAALIAALAATLGAAPTAPRADRARPAAPAAASRVAAATAVTAATTAPSPGRSKKDELLLAKSAAAARAPELRAAARPRAEQHLVNLYNTWTHEWLAVDAADVAGRASVPADELDRFLRCHYTNEATDMDPRLVGFLVGAAQHFHVDTVEIVSGFRHPKYNLMLRKKGHQVARDSQHTHGHAVDFYLPGVSTMALHDWAVAQKAGGVGLYLGSGFVHMDVGPVRYWNGD